MSRQSLRSSSITRRRGRSVAGAEFMADERSMGGNCGGVDAFYTRFTLLRIGGQCRCGGVRAFLKNVSLVLLHPPRDIAQHLRVLHVVQQKVIAPRIPPQPFVIAADLTEKRLDLLW